MEFQITQLLRIFFESLFVGFCVLIPLFSLIKTSNLKTLQLKEMFILQAIQAVRIAGIINALLVVQDAYAVYVDQSALGITYPVSFQLFTFYPPLMYLVLTQLLWIKKIYMKKAALIVLSILLLVLPSILFVTLLIALNTPGASYIPSSWKMHPGSLAIHIGLNIVIFFFTTFSLTVLSGKLKKIVDK